jgi:hypothetical protein
MERLVGALSPVRGRSPSSREDGPLLGHLAAAGVFPLAERLYLTGKTPIPPRPQPLSLLRSGTSNPDAAEGGPPLAEGVIVSP